MPEENRPGFQGDSKPSLKDVVLPAKTLREVFPVTCTFGTAPQATVVNVKAFVKLEGRSRHTKDNMVRLPYIEPLFPTCLAN